MSRNRLKNSHTMHWASVLKSVLIISMLCCLVVSYLLVKSRIFQLAEENRRREKDLFDWENRNSQLSLNIAQLKSPRELQRRVDGTGMVRLTELEVVQMDGSGVTRLARSSVRPGETP